MSEQTKPLLIYDGDCGFCRQWVERIQMMTGGRVEYRPFQKAMHDFPDIPRTDFESAVQLIEPSGNRYSAANAVFRTLSYARGWGFLSVMYRFVPGFSGMSECLYRFIARNRSTACRLHQK